MICRLKILSIKNNAIKIFAIILLASFSSSLISACAGNYPDEVIEIHNINSPTSNENCELNSCNDEEKNIQGSRLVFVTSQMYVPSIDFKSLEDADALCQSLADDTGLNGIFKAWLSDSYKSVATRFNRLGGPYVRVDGAIVAKDWGDLTDGYLNVPINLSETGEMLDESNKCCDLFTGTNYNGIPDFPFTPGRGPKGFCDNWDVANVIPGYDYAWDDSLYRTTGGRISFKKISWSKDGTIPCNESARLYCFQQ